MKPVYILLFLLFHLLGSGQNTNEIDIRINGRAPYSVFWDDYINLDNFTLDFRNKSLKEIEFEVMFNITGPYLLFGESNDPSCAQTFTPGALKMYTKNNIDDLCFEFRLADFNFDGLPETLQSDLLLNHVLPEGEYQICVYARAPGDPNSRLGSDCFKFNIVHPERPQITNPRPELNNTIDATTQNTLNVTWTHAINNPSILANTSYNIKIVDFGVKNDEIDNPATSSLTTMLELMENPGAQQVLFEQNVRSPHVLTLTDLNLLHEHLYGICVYAVNEEQPLGFDLLRSEIATFHAYTDFDLECGRNIAFDAISPAQGAYIPFTQVPLVMKYSPYCDKYIAFKSNTTLTDETTDQVLINNFERSLKWNHNSEGKKWISGGPRRYLNYIINDQIISGWDEDAFYSSHLALNDLNSLPTLVRGHAYTWSSSNMNMKFFKKPDLSSFMIPVGFTVGMQAPLLNAPIGGVKVDTGIVQFNIKFNDVSESILPPFKIFQIEDNEIIEYPPRNVNEYGVIQVSKNKLFTDNIMAKGIHLEFNEDDFYESNNSKTRKLDAAKLTNLLYADLNFEGSFKDTATYYWRLGWYKNPDAIPSEMSLASLTNNDFYNITTIDSFRIGDTTSSVDALIAAIPTDTVCGSSCTVALPVNTTSILNLDVNDQIIIGKFLATLTEVTKSGTTFSGKARIKIPFLNNVTVKTTFSNLKINTDKLVFDGELIAESGGTELESIANILLDQPMQLPLGWDATIKGRHTMLALTQMKFLSTRADMTASINFGDILPQHMLLPEQAEMSGTFCFHPGGFSETMLFHLSEDLTFDEENNGYGFLLKGGASVDTTTMCYISWDCKGFKGFQVAGEVLLSESLLNKDSGITTNDAIVPGRVKGGFKFKYNDSESANANDNGFIFTANLDAFQFKEFDGWGFDSDTLYIDWSDAENPPGFTVPNGYTYSGMNDAQLKNGWEGLYIPNVKVFTPKDFGKGVSTRTSFTGSKFIYGEGKYHLSLNAVNVFNDNWAKMRAKMDTIQGVISSDEKRIRFSGEMLLPFTDTTSWIPFGGHFSGFDSINLYMAIADQSVTVEKLPIKLNFDQTSLVNIVRGADRTFRANAYFNGYMDLTSNAGDVSSSLSSLNFKGIHFQSLGYKSGTGFLSGRFSLSSPQKTMNGFPIQLDSIDFVSEGGYQGIYLKPKVVLVGEVNGFTAEAGLNILFKFNGSGALDRITDHKIDLKDVGLDVAVSGFELKGKLKFINTESVTGMEGILAAKLPGGISAHLKAKFGTVTTDESASFNSASNYSYWYVDGMVTFGATGIPMFAGANLYGIGGGLWYHMNQNPITNTSYKNLVGTATDTANVNYSGIGYTPSYESNYGMKVQGLFGSQNEGKTFNMLLGVWAQFNTSGGPNVGLDGDMRFMGESVAKLANGDAQTTKKSVWGDVHFVYNGQEHFIQGTLNAYVNVMVGDNKVFYGKLDGDKMVEAEFFAGLAGNEESDKWYLKIGTPQAKAGAKFDLKIKKTDISAYLMVGYGLDPELPQPDPGFMAMLNNQDEGYIGGDASTATDKPIVYSASGIAAGVFIKDTFAFRFQPFYLEVDAIIGADLNITHDPERRCRETNEVPGVDGWYGTGQLYAGIQGAFGIEVDLWFIEGRFEFLRGSVALLMSGGLPNPSWFQAKGAFKYKVIGLIEGTHSMQINVGDKCTVGDGNPLAGMQIIQDLYPADGASDVSVYVVPKALISPYVNHEIEVFDTELNKERIFRVEWESNQLKKGSTIIPSNRDLTDGSEVYMPPKAVLDDKTNYTIEIKVTGSEKRDNSWVKIPDFVESKIHHFKTGVMPDEINDECLAYTYPVRGQNYFLKDEVPGSLGFITLRLVNERLIYTSKASASGIVYPYHYEARFYKGTSSIYEFKRNITIEGNQYLKFPVGQLANNTNYLCKIIRVLDPLTSLPINPQMQQTAASQVAQASATMSNANFTNVRQEGFKTVADVEMSKSGDMGYNYKILPQKFMKFTAKDDIPTEHVLFEYRFKTSQFNTLSQKIGGKSWAATKSSFFGDIFTAGTTIAEPFDAIDLSGWESFDASRNIVHRQPLVQFGSNLQYGQETYGENKYDFLPFDAIASRNNNNELYQLPKNLIDFIDPPNAPPINLGLANIWNYTTLKYRLEIEQNVNLPKLFDPPGGIAPLSQEAPTFQSSIGVSGIGSAVSNSSNTSSPKGSTPSLIKSNGTIAMASGSTNSTTTNSGSTSGTVLGNDFKIRLNHGVRMFYHNLLNQNVLSEFANVGVMNWIKSKNAAIENRLSQYILSLPSGYVECIDIMPMGIIYFAPQMQMGLRGQRHSAIRANINMNCPPPPPID